MQSAVAAEEGADLPTPSPEWLFAQGGTVPCGVVEWGQPVSENGSGVYVITVADAPVHGQHVVYIGRAKCLSRRLRQFYRHKHGARSPHRGGQDILTLPGTKTVHWARAEACENAERRMLDAFRAATGTWPYGNRVRSARPSATPT